jgi:hypothetical protein
MHPGRHYDPDPDGHTISDRHSDVHTDRYRDADSDWHSYGHAHFDRHAHGYCDEHAEPGEGEDRALVLPVRRSGGRSVAPR